MNIFKYIQFQDKDTFTCLIVYTFFYSCIDAVISILPRIHSILCIKLLLFSRQPYSGSFIERLIFVTGEQVKVALLC